MLIREISAFGQPRIGNRPSPSLFPLGKPFIPLCVIDSARHRIAQAGHGCLKRGFDALAQLLIVPRLLDLPGLIICLTVGGYATLFDGLDQRRNDTM